MKDLIMAEIIQYMLPYLNNAQAEQLKEELQHCFYNIEFNTANKSIDSYTNEELTDTFLSAKRIEGCSEKSLKYYKKTIETMYLNIGKNIRAITTEDLRSYLTNYSEKHNSSKVTIDNIRRILSSFFAWLEDEDYIIKSPVRRIHKVKSAKTIKETYSDEELEKMRDNCENKRDLALIDILASTGMATGISKAGATTSRSRKRYLGSMPNTGKR